MTNSFPKIVASTVLSFVLLTGTVEVKAESVKVPEVSAQSVILIEQETKKVLYEKNADEVIYPASMTKILTAIEMVEHIDLDEVLVTGSEVHNIPLDSSKAGHQQGESILGLNLLRALLLPSGNETGCVVAAAVAKRVTGNSQLPYQEAEKLFCDLMNERAKEAGATNTHFVNPHGYHDDDHYTTARDMAMISKAAMDNKTIARIVSEPSFSGDGVGDGENEGMKTQDYFWRNTNYLITDTDYYYEYATGIKTGFTNEAGRCLAASAEKDGIKLIAVVANSDDPDRWVDTISLFEYGFDNFKYLNVQKDNEFAAEIILHNPILGEDTISKVMTKGSFESFLSQEEYNSIEKEIIFHEDRFVLSKEEESLGQMQFILPIEKGEELGKIRYTVGGELLYEGELVAFESIEERTGKTDFEYYKNMIKSNLFSLKAVPFYLGSIAVIVIIVFIVRKIRHKRDRYSYSYKSRRW